MRERETAHPRRPRDSVKGRTNNISRVSLKEDLTVLIIQGGFGEGVDFEINPKIRPPHHAKGEKVKNLPG